MTRRTQAPPILHRFHRRPLAGLTLISVLAAALSAGCDRNVEPFDPDVKPKQPDLSRIFPERPDGPPPGSQLAETMPAPRGNVAPPAEGPAAEPIRGRIEVAPGLASELPRGATLFLIARRAGQTGGPPLAVLRVPDPKLPLDFEIGPDQVMIPSMRFEGEVQLSARLDGDGNALSRTPGDLQGPASEPLLPGATGVRLVLSEKL